MKADDRVLVMGEDVGARGGVFRATAGFLEEFGEPRVIDTPLAESSIVGVAIGMALHGLLPVAEIQFADFIHPAFDQLVSEAARMRYRSNGDFGLTLVVRAPYGGGVHGALYHSQSIEAFYGHVPGLKVVLPSTPYDVKGMLRAAIREPDPVLFLEHKKTYRLIKGDVPDEDYTVPTSRRCPLPHPWSTPSCPTSSASTTGCSSSPSSDPSARATSRASGGSRCRWDEGRPRPCRRGRRR